MNGTECRPQAPVAEGGPAPYEGSLGDAPKTLFLFLATPYPLRYSEGGSKSSASPTEVRRGESTGLVPRGSGE